MPKPAKLGVKLSINSSDGHGEAFTIYEGFVPLGVGDHHQTRALDPRLPTSIKMTWGKPGARGYLEDDWLSDRGQHG